MQDKTAHGEFVRLDGLRRGFLNRCEKYAAFTHPRLMTEEGYAQATTELAHDWQSVGAQATNHLVNKLMLALFAPSRPFFRLEADAKWKAQAVQQGIDEALIDAALSKAERDAVRELDTRPLRPKLYQLLMNLVVMGNVLFYLPRKDKEEARVFGLKNFVCRRTGAGKIKEVIIRECLLFDELEPDVQAIFQGNKAARRYQPDTKVDYYRWLKRSVAGRITLTQWVDSHQLPEQYDGDWSEEQSPWRVLTWQLADKDDYGTGHVEDYAGDFAALSSLSQAQVEGAILASEFRWLVNPGGMTKPEDLQDSDNGAALPGVEGDVSLIANSKPGDLQVIQAVAADYIRRIGQGFLLGSAVTRNAERVTAEEIRQQATELETSLGGVYSRIAVDLQAPIADWLLLAIKFSLAGTQIKRSIVTGLDALSRAGDLDALRAALADLAQIGVLPDDLRAVIKLDAVVSTIFAGHGIEARKYVKDANERQADAQAAQEAEQQQVAAAEGARAAANQIAQGPAQ